MHQKHSDEVGVCWSWLLEQFDFRACAHILPDNGNF
jgi:hypothetical protein